MSATQITKEVIRQRHACRFWYVYKYALVFIKALQRVLIL
jgi:hypothetical protein